MSKDNIPKNLHYARILRYMKESEEKRLAPFKQAIGSDDIADLVRTLSWGPNVDAAVDSAVKIQVFSDVIHALEHTPDPENPVPADSESPEERVSRIHRWIQNKVLRSARYARSTSLNANLAEQDRLAAWADVAEVLSGDLF